MRTFNKKNEKIIIIVFICFFIIIFYFLIQLLNFKETRNLFIENKSLISMIENNKTSIIYDYIKNRDKVYVYNALTNQDKKYISMHFPSIKYIGFLRFFIYSVLFKDKIMFYASDDGIINKLKILNIKYCRVVLNIDNINIEEYLTLKDSNNTKLFLSITNKDFSEIDINNINRKYLISLDKDLIKVSDGDTIKYKNNNYRFIGVDAPELKQDYGTNVKNYVIEKINNASNVSMIVSSYDIFDRILCHLFIDDVPLAYYMMKDKQAKETIMKYGDNGFINIASNIVYLSKFQGRRPFTDPARFRAENR
ncbi:thermonuclease family protein [Brachyspira innocens]|uniref:Thermonuclease family protein n=1 Tax=Brachyspira innocens TaxID=13264 RepID=A0ABT8YYW2_9SPIR|nr:thermonuclease family protein [Brachyspira innocens]MDO6994369.1 thermonuclease family protein [Brachyspira innocens]MDO7020776.1 thermonuclease family protein [Brachyspira innocens]